MKLVLHLVRNDIRALRWEVAATAAVVLSSAYLEFPRHSAELVEVELWWLPAILATVLLVLRVVQKDGLIGTEHDWLTRPVSRWQMAAAKALFVLIFVAGPLGIRAAIVIAANGFQVHEYLAGLAWWVWGWAVVILLPATALGVVTRNMPQAVFAVLLLAYQSISVLHSRVWVGLDWVRYAMWASMFAITAAVVLWLQYSQRRTERARMVAVVGVLASLSVPIVIPWGALYQVQRWLMPREIDASSVTVRLQAARASAWAAHRPNPQVYLPFEVMGTAAGQKLRVLKVDATVATTGESDRDYGMQYSSSDVSDPAGVTVEISESQYRVRATQPVKVKGRVYLVVLAPEVQREFPYQGLGQMVSGAGFCDSAGDDPLAVYCRTPFRWAVEMRMSRWTNEPHEFPSIMNSGSRRSLSLVPSFGLVMPPRKGFENSGTRTARYGDGRSSTDEDFTRGRVLYETWAPVAYIERDFELVGRNLSEYRIETR